MLKSLGLVGDGDELDLIQDIESVFGVAFADAELEAGRTVGDLNEALWRHMSARVEAGNVRCMNAMAFNALRRVLVAADASRNIRHSDRLESFGMKPKELSRAIHGKTGLVLGFALGRLGNAGTIAVLAGIACVLLGIAWHGLFAAALALFLCAWAAFRLDTGSYEGCETVGDATAKIAVANFGALADRGGRFDAGSVWLALRETVAHNTGCPELEIGPDTLVMHSQPAKMSG